MQIKKILGKIEASKTYINWRSMNKNYFLVHLFTMFEKEEEIEWQAGYYDQKDDKMVVFFLRDKIVFSPETEILKTGDKITALNVENITLDWDKALAMSKDLQSEKYSNEFPFKYILLLQEIDNKPTWNITIVMKSFSTLNIKIDAVSGEILIHNLAKLFNPLK